LFGLLNLILGDFRPFGSFITNHFCDNRTDITLAILLLILAGGALAQADAPLTFDIPWFSIDGGGGQSTGGVFLPVNFPVNCRLDKSLTCKWKNMSISLQNCPAGIFRPRFLAVRHHRLVKRPDVAIGHRNFRFGPFRNQGLDRFHKRATANGQALGPARCHFQPTVAWISY